MGFATPEVDRVVQANDDDDELTTSEEASSVANRPPTQQELRISDMVSTASEKESGSENNPNVNVEEINFDDEVMLYDTQL